MAVDQGMQIVAMMAALLLILPALPAFRRNRRLLHRGGMAILAAGLIVAIALTIAHLSRLG